MFQDNLNYDLIEATKSGDIYKIDYLLNSPELEKKAQINFNNGYAFETACKFGNLNIIKYFLTDPHLKEHSDIHSNKDAGFKWACDFEYWSIIEFFILDMDIGITPEIQSYLDNSSNSGIERVKKLFEIKKLSRDLIKSSSLISKTEEKINKV